MDIHDSFINTKSYFLLLVLLICVACNSRLEEKTVASNESPISKPRVSFTFDDGNTSDLGGFPLEKWNEMILDHLEKENLNATFFVTGQNKLNEKGKYLLESWDNKGHQIANHTFSHPFFNSPENTSQTFEKELLKTDRLISTFSNYVKLFRFPYLKEGENPNKVDSLRAILSENGYSNGYVTIDASDWYVDQRLRNRINEVGFEQAEIDEFCDFYVEHILDRAEFYESLSFELNKRHISHTLLLHHNLTSALFLGNLIKAFKEKGWEVQGADEAYQDEIFSKIPEAGFAGESLIYSIAKSTGSYDHLLRYPAEDSRYEKDKMDLLGL